MESMGKKKPRPRRYAVADHLRTDLIADALTNAVAARDPTPG